MKLTGRIEELLMRVEKPAAYMGGELHSYDKEEESVDLNFGFCFPDGDFSGFSAGWKGNEKFYLQTKQAALKYKMVSFN